MRYSENKQGKSVRLLRVGEQIRHVVADLLARGTVHDEVIAAHPITVSEVRVSPDIRHATVFIQPLGGIDQQPVLDALKHHAKYLKGEVGHRLSTKYTPELTFRLDESFNQAKHIDDLLKDPRVAQDLKHEDLTPET